MNMVKYGVLWIKLYSIC